MRTNVSRAAVVINAKEHRQLTKAPKNEKAKAAKERLRVAVTKAKARVQTKAGRPASVLYGRKVVSLFAIPGGAKKKSAKKLAKKKNPEGKAITCVAAPIDLPSDENPKKRPRRRKKNPGGKVVSVHPTASGFDVITSADGKTLDAETFKTRETADAYAEKIRALVG